MTKKTADDPREALSATARALVHGVTQPMVLALGIVTGELRRFPELGRAWDRSGPRRAATMLAEVHERFVNQGQLRIPVIDIAVIQLLALTLYPHLVANSFGKQLAAETGEKLMKAASRCSANTGAGCSSRAAAAVVTDDC